MMYALAASHSIELDEAVRPYVHPDHLQTIKQQLEKYRDDPAVEITDKMAEDHWLELMGTSSLTIDGFPQSGAIKFDFVSNESKLIHPYESLDFLRFNPY